MKIFVHQFNAELGAVDRNLKRIEGLLAELVPGETDLVLFPEMCDTGYAMDVIVERAVTWDENHLAGIKREAARLGATVVVGVSERTGNDVFNTAAVIDAAGKLACKYRKTHLVSIAPIHEDRYLTPGGALGFFAAGGTNFGVMTCYELRFPEVARTLTLRGARVLLVPTAWPAVRVEHLTSLLRARAIENQVFVVCAGRVGTDAGTTFSGNSMIIDPNGTVLARGSAGTEEWISADIDLAAVDASRERIAALDERRPRLYDL
ncbi:putative amidohydrolase [Lewinella marina]|uniref:Carbon-nitrogen hydrolase n=1 Tax=Neolewinella marina TaxID=438751 RepID=A0A2G0CGG1_9BACT|nr:nitrilase-related carbon-nitrogen hydrolase [Neolewinella marina]NJB86478.1 putative amidohydrolase [Neolewinella marina]PHK99062.1 carbon-nitrogen hydrolase [Neolewinella marina]